MRKDYMLKLIDDNKESIKKIKTNLIKYDVNYLISNREKFVKKLDFKCFNKDKDSQLKDVMTCDTVGCIVGWILTNPSLYVGKEDKELLYKHGHLSNETFSYYSYICERYGINHLSETLLSSNQHFPALNLRIFNFLFHSDWDNEFIYHKMIPTELYPKSDEINTYKYNSALTRMLFVIDCLDNEDYKKLLDIIYVTHEVDSEKYSHYFKLEYYFKEEIFNGPFTLRNQSIYSTYKNQINGPISYKSLINKQSIESVLEILSYSKPDTDMDKILDTFKIYYSIDIITTFSQFSRLYGFKYYTYEDGKTVCYNHFVTNSLTKHEALVNAIKEVCKFIIQNKYSMNNLYFREYHINSDVEVVEFDEDLFDMQKKYLYNFLEYIK